MKNTLNAKDFGFLPENDAAENSKALNAAVADGGEIHVDLKGTYELSETVILKSNTSLIFGDEVYIKRAAPESERGYVFINEGAYTRTYDENIKISGLKLICNGITDESPSKNGKICITGLKGHISLFYVKNAVIDGFEVYDLPPASFAVHICTFENICVENCRIEGEKDGIHLGRGKGFVIRNCVFKTFDDPIALNAHDYVTSNPQLGWIEDGVIENCTDLDAERTTGYFCRILCGAWVDWYNNMIVRNSDTVVSNGRVYRALMKPDGNSCISKTAPTHESGIEVLDGISWVMVQEEIIYNCGCRNILFDGIYLKKKRTVGFSLHFDDDNWSHSYYPSAVPPIQKDITFKNIHLENKIPIIVSAVTPIDDIRFVSSDLKKSIIVLDKIKSTNLPYPMANISFKNVMFDSYISDIIKCRNLRKVNYTID